MDIAWCHIRRDDIPVHLVNDLQIPRIQEKANVYWLVVALFISSIASSDE